MCCQYPVYNRGHPLIRKKTLEKPLLFLGFELRNVDAVNVRYFNLVRPNLDALDIFELG